MVTSITLNTRKILRYEDRLTVIIKGSCFAFSSTRLFSITKECIQYYHYSMPLVTQNDLIIYISKTALTVGLCIYCKLGLVNELKVCSHINAPINEKLTLGSLSYVRAIGSSCTVPRIFIGH